MGLHLGKVRGCPTISTTQFPPVSHDCGCVMIWFAILWESFCSITALHYCKTAKESEAILKDQVHSVVQILLLLVPIFQNDYSLRQPAKHSLQVIQFLWILHKKITTMQTCKVFPS